MRSTSFSSGLLLLHSHLLLSPHFAASFSSVPNVPSSSSHPTTCGGTKSSISNNNILILDHLNINHEAGRHDWLRAFYVDGLQCALDPRKQANVERGRQTLWMNIGAQQFHLPEGTPNAQVLDGSITLVFPDLERLERRMHGIQQALQGSSFDVTRQNDDETLLVTDPWGTQFRLVQGQDPDDRDSRGRQAGHVSEGLGMKDLTIHTPPNCNLEGIGRFYEQVLGSVVLRSVPDESCTIAVGSQQTLTFRSNPCTTLESHVDLREDRVDPPVGAPVYLSNYGPHISIYVADLPSSYRKADALGLVYVNPRFKRRAYTLDEAIDQCMFRCLDIVDPERVDEGPILQLEHEVRSVVKRDGSMYSSCPFDEIPEGCV